MTPAIYTHVDDIDYAAIDNLDAYYDEIARQVSLFVQVHPPYGQSTCISDPCPCSKGNPCPSS